MSQTITIVIDGKDGVLPDSVGDVVSAVFHLVDLLDKRSWRLGAPRIRWKLSDSKLVNPFTITAEGREVMQGHDNPELALSLLQYLEEIAAGNMPRGATKAELKFARVIGREARRSKVVSVCGEAIRTARQFTVPKSFARMVSLLIQKPKVRTNEYGAIEGGVIKLENDPLKEIGTVRIRERSTNYEVSCEADPAMTAKMCQYANRETRLAVYGTIAFDDGIPVSVRVEDFATIPSEDSLPTLEEVRAMKLRPPTGGSIEKYLADLRGDE